MSDWCTIESDPGVFTELIEKIGVKGINVEEVYSLEDETLLQQLGKIHGFIFLFKWQQETDQKQCLQNYPQDLFFAHQVITNACATQAILSILMNIEGLEMGEELTNFKSFAMALDANTRGMIIGDCDIIKRVHNSFAKPEPFIIEGKRKSTKDDDVFHFISYVPFKNNVYELDGLQQGPILHGEAGDNWINTAKAAINARIAKYASNEIRFTLLAITESKSVKAEQQINSLKKLKGRLYQGLQGLQGDGFDLSSYPDFQECVDLTQGMEEENQEAIPSTEADILSRIQSVQNEILTHQSIIEDEQTKRSKFEAENVRRRHNYIPFILELLKISAERGDLQKLYDESKAKMTTSSA